MINLMELEINEPFLLTCQRSLGCGIIDIFQESKCYLDIWVEGNNSQDKVGRSHCDCLLQHYSNFMAWIWSTLSFKDKITRGCGNIGRNVGTRLSLWILVGLNPKFDVWLEDKCLVRNLFHLRLNFLVCERWKIT